MNTNNSGINPIAATAAEAVQVDESGSNQSTPGTRGRRINRAVAAGLAVAFTFGAVACSDSTDDADPLTDNGGITDDGGVTETPLEEAPLEEAPLEEEAPADDGAVEE